GTGARGQTGGGGGARQMPEEPPVTKACFPARSCVAEDGMVESGVIPGPPVAQRARRSARVALCPAGTAAATTRRNIPAWQLRGESRRDRRDAGVQWRRDRRGQRR